MNHILTWIVPVALLSLGLAMLAPVAREYSVSWLIARRLHDYVSPHLKAPAATVLARRALEWLGRKVTGAAPVKTLQALLLQAGFMNPSAIFIFAGLRFVAAIALFGATLLWHGVVTPKTATAAFALAFIVYRGFTIALKLRMEARQRAIRRELPYVLDLILMVLDSGVSIDQAMHHICGQIERAAPICAGIIARYIADTEEGMPYDKALERLAQRLAVNEGRDFVAILKQNLFQGGELAPPLHRLASDIGEGRLATAREQAGRKSVLLTLVMLVFFMPVLMVALAGPAVSDLTGTLSNVAHDMQNSRMRP